MKSYYVLDANPFDFEHLMTIIVPKDSNIDPRAIYFGQLQYINSEPVNLYISKRTEEIPDIYNYDLPLISSRVKDVFDDIHVENVSYKPAILIDEDRGEYYQYYIPLIKPIECVVWGKSKYVNNSSNSMKDIKGGFVIDESKAGNFKIFKIQDALNEIWIIEKKLKDVLEDIGIKGAVMVGTESYK